MTGRHFLFGHFFIAPTCAKMLTDKGQKAFFDLLTANKGGTPFTDKLKALVDDAKRNTQWRVQFMTWERQQAYAYRDGKKEGITIGEERGRAEGSRTKALEAARNLLAMHVLTNEQIAQATGLSAEEIAQL